MLSATDLHGLMAMMPAFATDDAAELEATATVDIVRLHAGVDRMVRDGANVIATTGSFGECHALVLSEFKTVVQETVAAVKGRIPVIVGVPSENAREAVEKIRIAQEAGADGVLVAIPYYIPSTTANAVNFLRKVANTFPTLAILIYHNPAIHHFTLPVDAFRELVNCPNIVGMKDSHRDAFGLMQLQAIVRGRISIFVGQWQYFAHARLGAAGLWSIDAWMGPWPLLALRDAVSAGDWAAAEAITTDIVPSRANAGNLMWRETASKLGIQMAGYVEPGPLRAPFNIIPAEVEEAQRRHAAYWAQICKKYAPQPAVAR